MKFLKLFSRVILLVVIFFLFDLNNYSQETTHTLTGSLVDSEKKPITGVTIIVKTNHHGDAATTTGADGTYSLSIPDDGPLTIKYVKTGYMISPISYISGASNQNINRIMVNTTGEVEFNESDAEEIAKTLEIYKSNPELYADAINLYANAIKMKRLPQKYRPVLKEFEEVASNIRKDRARSLYFGMATGGTEDHTYHDKDRLEVYAEIPGLENEKIEGVLTKENGQTSIVVTITNPTEPLSEYYLIVKDKTETVYHLELNTISTASYFILRTSTSLSPADFTLFISDDKLNSIYVFKPSPKSPFKSKKW